MPVDKKMWEQMTEELSEMISGELSEMISEISQEKQKPNLKKKKKPADSKLLKQSPELLKVLLGRMRQQAVILDEDTIALIDFFDKYLEDYPNQMRIDDSLFYE